MAALAVSEVQAETRQRGNPPEPDCGATLTYRRWRTVNPDLERIDAELLAAQVLGTGRAQIIAFPETRLGRQQAEELDRLANRRRQGEPLAYILGRKEFYGLSFRVGEEVLVPRPETELLVELALELAPRNARVLDLGTGCGCIAVALKRERPDLRITATDISFPALTYAVANAAEWDVAISFVQGNWLDAVGRGFDCIVANPPYVAEGDPALKSLHREPRLALAAGTEGLAAIDRIAEQALSCLTHRGCLILEHGSDQAAAVRERLALGNFADIQTHRDFAGMERATVVGLGH